MVRKVPVIVPELALPLFLHQAILVSDGRVLVGSGFTGAANNDVIFPFPAGAVHAYDPAGKKWTLLEPSLLAGFMGSLINLADGRVLAVGPDGPFDTPGTNLFDPQESSWTALPSAPRNRALPNLALLNDGRVLVLGGLDFSGSSSPDVFQEVDIFDPSTQEWQPAAPLNRAFVETDYGLVVIPLEDGRVIALGETESDFGLTNSWAEVYDPASDTWTSVDVKDVAYTIAAGTRLLDGTILVLGGTPLVEIGILTNDGSPPSAEEEKAKIEARFPSAKVYDAGTDTWTPTEAMQYPRIKATVTLMADGRVLVAGGTARGSSIYDQEEDQLTSFTEIYDPATNTWLPGPELKVPRTDHTATELPDGRVLIAGGIGVHPRNGEQYPLSSVEFIEP